MTGTNERREWELKLASGKVVVWAGRDGDAAARRYVDANPAKTVVATRNADRHGVRVFGPGARIIEPGDGHPAGPG